MMVDDNTCPLSGHKAKITPDSYRDWDNIICEVCGTYSISREAVWRLQSYGRSITGRLYLLSGIARRRSDSGNPVSILTDNIEYLLASVTPPGNPQELLDHALLYIADRIQTFFATIKLDPNKDYPVAFATDPAELEYTLREGAELGFFIKNADEIRLRQKGWDRINELRSRKIKSTQAFVAMWFDPKLEPIWKTGFQPALQQVGYSPLRIDEKQFNDKIDDKIIAEIRRSGLLVADVTGHRAGVYYEAGFATGLGLPVIWTCEEADIENAHFDTRQYNHIVWKDAGDLKLKLVSRIEATGLAHPLRGAHA